MATFFSNRRTQAEPELPQETALVDVPQPVGFDTVIGTDCELDGKFVSSGNVRMEGKFSGTLEISGNILVGESAEIVADINAKNISIAGTVRGHVTGHKVQLLQTGRIWGDISASSLTTEEGAFIDGKITMMGHSATRPPTDAERVEHENAIDDMTKPEDDEIPATDDVVIESDAVSINPEFVDTEPIELMQDVDAPEEADDNPAL